MKIKSNYVETVTYGIYNQDDIINAIALKDGTLDQGGKQEWNPGDRTTVKIIFKRGLIRVASKDVPTLGTTTLEADGSIV